MNVCRLILPVTAVIAMAGCNFSVDGSVDDEKVDALNAQLETVYEQCESEQIESPEDIEGYLNNNGNGLSKGCRNALRTIDFNDLADVFDLNITIKLAGFDHITPWLDQPDDWYIVKAFDRHIQTLILTTTSTSVDFNDIDVVGITSEGEADALTSVSYQPLLGGQTSTAFVIDYSASMLEADIVEVSSNLSAAVTALPSSTESTVVYFSTEVTNQTSGYITDKITLAQELQFDATIERESTALYDGIGVAMDTLPSDSTFHLNVLVTDGMENASEDKSKSEITALLQGNGIYTLVVASGFADKNGLMSLVGDQGLLIYQYNMDEIGSAIGALDSFISNANTLSIGDNLTAYQRLDVYYLDQVVASISLQ